MRSGTKNCCVDIVRNVEGSTNDHNEPIYGRSPWKQGVWATATPRRGRETEIEGGIVYESYMRFDFDFYDVEGIEATMVIVHEGVEYGIAGILPDINTKQYTTVDGVSRPAGTDRT